MARLALAFIALAVTSQYALSQSYIGYVEPVINVYARPNADSEVLVRSSYGQPLFVISAEPVNGFVHVIYIPEDVEGYIIKDHVRLDEVVPLAQEGLFVPEGAAASEAPDIAVHNTTHLPVTLAMDDLRFRFDPGEQRTIQVPAGQYNCRASAPGLLPHIAAEQIETGVRYSWRFYVAGG